jgi:hypothetical protein
MIVMVHVPINVFLTRGDIMKKVLVSLLSLGLLFPSFTTTKAATITSPEITPQEIENAEFKKEVEKIEAINKGEIYSRGIKGINQALESQMKKYNATSQKELNTKQIQVLRDLEKNVERYVRRN